MGWTNTGKRAKPERKPELVIPESGKPGQILVRTTRGVEWQDRRIVANLKYISSQKKYVCDKTFAEMQNAFLNGKEVLLRYGEFLLHMSLLEEDEQIAFYWCMEDIYGVGEEAAWGTHSIYALILSDNTVKYTEHTPEDD